MNAYTIESLIPGPEAAHLISKTSKGVDRDQGLSEKDVCSRTIDMAINGFLGPSSHF